MSKQYTAYEIIHPIVIEVRKTLAKKYDVRKDSWTERYTGLCYKASELFVSKMKEKCARMNISVDVRIVHGEQAHTPRIKCARWAAEHTWNSIKIFEEQWYVDCTSSQFNDWYKDIPEYYISKKPPKWYYPDRSNPKWNGITRRLDEKIRFKRTWIDKDGDERHIESGIVDVLQYDVWGTISDLIRKILGKDKKNE